MNRLKKAREDAGLSQSELAQLISCPQATISALENDRIKRPSHDLVTHICAALHRKPEDVFPVALFEKRRRAKRSKPKGRAA